MLSHLELHVPPKPAHRPYEPLLVCVFIHDDLDVEYFIRRALAAVAERHDQRIMPDGVQWMPFAKFVRHRVRLSRARPQRAAKFCPLRPQRRGSDEMSGIVVWNTVPNAAFTMRLKPSNGFTYS